MSQLVTKLDLYFKTLVTPLIVPVLKLQSVLCCCVLHGPAGLNAPTHVRDDARRIVDHLNEMLCTAIDSPRVLVPR